jgi:hypothetical protein
VLVVHGVHGGSDKDVNGVKEIETLVAKSLASRHIVCDCEVSGYFYEDINDNAQEFYKKLAGAIYRGKPLAGAALKTVIDYAGDVTIATAQGSTAGKIVNGLIQKIQNSYVAGHQVVLVSHSLGTVYSLRATIMY